MAFKTFVALDPLLASEVNTYLMKQVVIVCTSGTRPSSPVDGMHIYETDTDRRAVYNGTVWITVSPQSQTVATSQGTASTTYADLATVGPAQSALTGTTAIITIGCYASNTGANLLRIAVAVSGASTIAAADGNGTLITGPAAGIAEILFRSFVITGLTAGSNTFTMKYSVSAGTGTFVNRDITVVGQN